MAPWLWPCLLAAQALAANFPPRYSLYTGGAAPLAPGPAAAHSGARAASRHRNWCAYVVTRSVSCVVEDGVESFIKPDYQPCPWGQLQCPRVLAYRSFLRPRYKVSQRTVSELAWRCCQGYSGPDCSEGPAPAAPQPTGRPPARPGRPTLSGFGNPLSGLGGEGGGDPEKVRRLEEQVRRLSEQLEELRAGQEPPRAAVEGQPGGQQAADAERSEVREALSHLQRRLEELESRLQRAEGGRDGAGAPGAAGTAALDELEQRLQELCAACTTGTEGLRRQAAEHRERMRALEKLVESVDQRNRDAVESVQRHISSLSSRLAPAPAAPPAPDVLRRLAELERRLAGLPVPAAGPGQGQGPVLARRLAELEGRLNASRAGPWPSEPEGRPAGLPGRLANLSRAVEGLAASGAQRGARLEQLEALLARCGPPCPAGDIEELWEDGLAGTLGGLRGQALAEALERLRNRTGRLEAALEELSAEPCARPCALPLPRQPEPLPPGPAESEEEPEAPLEGFGVFGGPSPSELRALRGELAAALAALSGLNATVEGLQDELDEQDARQRQLSAATDRVVAELDRAAAAAAARQAESEERLEALARELARAGGCPAGLEPRVAKLEGVCEQLEAVAGGLRGLREGLGRHVAGLWGAVRELNATARGHAALLDKALELPARLGALNASLGHLRGELQRLSLLVPAAGTFTVPVPGRYLVSAVLTGHRGEALEAVLSRSGHGIARLDSAGFQPEALEKGPVAARGPSPGALGVFSLLLPLAAGETLCVDLVSGRLAHAPDEPLTAFSAALLYGPEEP
uniref:Elastin microfibril interfacer 1 n=1 Tax=Junco hyemalis TaxID=40217 RepID=A0A8C5IZR2_JUNHY